MPIVNCIVSSDVSCASETLSENLTVAWAKAANVANAYEEMTINIIASSTQYGKRYPVMAWLYLPSIWSTQDIDRLQVGLAQSLSTTLGVHIGGVQVITTLVNSGLVVEQGSKVNW